MKVMKKGLKLVALVSALFLGNTFVQAQTGLKRANKQYDNLAYYYAINTYEQVANNGFVSSDILKKLGNSYYFNGEYASANKWYGILFTDYNFEDLESEYYYRYAETLKNIGDNQNADLYFKKFAEKNQNSTRALIISSKVDSQEEIVRNSGRYILSSLEINSPYSDYSANFHDDKLLFTSARDTGNFFKRIFSWTGGSFTKIYQSEIDSVGNLAKPKRFNGKVNSIFNESSPVITKDGKTMYFTRNNYLNGERGYNLNNITLLKIYRAEFIDNKWTNVTELPFNDHNFNTAHPTLNTNEDEMYFISDRSGGFGSSDIWKVSILEEGFGQPINLGSEINTDGRETFVFITDNNELYFSSDGRPSLGGLDVFASKILKDGSFSPVQNVGAPLNSQYDDFGYIINQQTKRGYFSSNRNGGIGKDDIYGFLETRSLNFNCIQDLGLIVVDSKTKAVIPNAKIDLYDMGYGLLNSTNRMKDGSYVFDYDFECSESYRVRVDYPEYEIKEEVVVLDSEQGKTIRTIEINRKKIEIKPQDDLFKVLSLKPIYFDFDKDFIRPDAAEELAKIVVVMKDNPKMIIDVRSFTDSRGNDDYNLKLSQRRAKSTAEWIISQGISSDRITYKGFGETLLLNHCKDSVQCSNEEHEVNRRSEFIVIKL
ncbi:OmpA family protein [Paenimyroides tangerinum]|uniref:OmpA family protein n=2 Tax=Paenimyroides tangerinum TaxID=2488728 RepID=A0A3P3W9F6_9FLAO|nr:OmpA family protein [Paenimyroides tangerinum]